MPLPLGPIAAKLGLAAGRQVAAGVENRRQRADIKAAADLQRDASYLKARQSLIEALTQATDPQHREVLQAQLNQLEATETQRVKTTERGKTTRRIIGAAAVVGVLAGGAGFAYKNIKDFREAVVPDVTVTTEQTLSAALRNVKQVNDKTILTGTGDGEATVSTRANVGMFGIDVRLPGGLVGSEAKVKVTRNLDIVSHPGAVVLKPMQDPRDGSWDVLALVNPAKITPRLSGEQPPAPDSSATSGFFNDLGHALGFNEDEQARLYEDAETLAVNSFVASASRIMTEPRTIAASEANSIRQGIQEASGAVPPGQAHDALVQLAMADIHVAFVEQNGEQMTFIDPGDAGALQAHMSLPKPPASSNVRVSALEISMTTPPTEQFLMSQETRRQLAEIESQPGYELVPDPSVIAPYATTQATR